MKFVLASNNKGKLVEMGDILKAMGHEIMSMAEAGVTSEPEETGETFEENALIKARACMAECGLPSLADDSGLCVDALGGAPGVHTARYAPKGQGKLTLLRNMEGVPAEKRTAQFVSAIACVFPKGVELVVRGECAGEITEDMRGFGGFGYDPIFYVPKYKQTYAELQPEIKNKISHRAIAMERLQQKLQEKGDNIC